MKPIYSACLITLLLATSLHGCTTSGPANTAAGEDEFEGRLFSWQFTDKAAEAESIERQPASSTSAGSSASNAETLSPTPSAKRPHRIRYSKKDDENGDRGFILHGAIDSDHNGE